MLWNSHRLRSSANNVTGRPFVMFRCSHVYGADNYLKPVTTRKVDNCLLECLQKNGRPCDEAVSELCEFLLEDSSRHHPENAETAVITYQYIRKEIQDGLGIL